MGLTKKIRFKNEKIENQLILAVHELQPALHHAARAAITLAS